MTPETVVPVVVFIAVVLVAYAVAGLWGAERRFVAGRVARHAGEPGAAAESAGGSSGGAELLLDSGYSTFQSFDRMLRRSSYPEKVAMDLTRAAVPLRVGEYLLLRWIAALGLFGISLTFLKLNVVVCLVFGVAGYFLPRLYVNRKEASRVKKFEEQLVDALTMMANALKSGSSFLQAIDLVAREQPAPISQEFARVVAEANVGASVEKSLLELSVRVRSYDLYLVVTAMLVQREVGGNLSEVLENIAHTIRERQRILNQIRVETAEVRLSGYVIAALPVFFLIVILMINRGYAEMLTTGTGQIILAFCAVMEFIGFMIIRKIVDIEV